MKTKKQILSILMALALVISMIPMSSITVNAASAVSYIDCSYDGSKVISTEKSVTDYTTVTNHQTNWSDGWYVVSESVTISSSIYVSGTVHLILCDGVTLKANGGINVASGNTLYIYAQSSSDNMGSLSATHSTGVNKAGIGSFYNQSAGTIIINGGNVTATGQQYGAGIGGGESGYRENASGGSITINGGTVTATGGRNAAGIGGGYGGSGGTVVITGGNVKAIAGANASAIGSGKDGSGGTLQDGNGNKVSKVTITLDGAAASTQITNTEGITYGLNDVYTLDTNKLYFYLPSGATATSITAGETDYICNRSLTYYTSHGELSDATCVSAPICSACGKESGSKLEHSYQYSANENVITETCNKGCGHSAEAKLTASDTNYTGSPITTGASIAYGESWAGNKPQPAVSDYSNNTNAGTATVTTTVEGKELTTTFEIKKADISGATVTLDPASGEYTGNAYTPSVTVTLDGFGTLVEDVHYTVSWDDKNEFINADTYTATIVGKDNFENEKTATFIITDANITVIEVKQKDTLTYNGKEQTPDVSKSATSVNNQPITFEYSTEKGNYGAMPTFKDAGTYIVYYEAKADNHIAAYGEFKVTINKQTVDVPDISDKEYNGETQTADITDTAIYTVTENNGGKDAGKYNVELTLTDSKNYKWENTDDAAVTLDFEITKATNKWMPEPTISGWTYGDTASTPNYKAKFGTVNIRYSGTANDDTAWDSDSAPTKAGKYTATFTVADNSNYGGLEKAVDFEIEKATYDMSGAKWDDTTSFNYDGTEKTVTVTGLPDGVTVNGYEGNKATVVGDYTAKVTLSYDGNNYNTPVVADLPWSIVNTWQPTEYTVTKLNDNGWINGDFEITAQDGYKIATDNKDTSEWSDKLTYTAETDNGKVTFYLRNTNNNEISLAKTVNYKLDKTNPTGTVEFVGREPWQEFLSTITFGLFFKDEVTVKAEATDALSGVASIEYYEADELMTLDEVKAIKNWTAYNDSFGISVEDTKKFIYFVRITDKAGNVTYLSTDGAEYDTTLPAISGIENGATYYTTQVVTVEDKNLASVELDGETVTLDNDTFTLAGNVDATYTIKVTDKAGNVTEYTVTMKTLAELTKSLDDITVGDVTSDDKEIIEQVIGDIDEQLANDDLTEDEKAALEETKDKAQDLLDKIDEAANADDTDNTEKVKDITADNVTPEDKSDLEKAKDDLTKTLDDYSDNLTEDEKKAIEDEINRINDALEVIGNVEAVEDKIGSLPESITKNDEAAIKAADEAYNALSDYEKSLVDKDAKKALDDAKAALAELNKPADTTSPNTGDNSNLWLWVALLFISGGGVITLTVVDSKKRKVINK